MRAINKGIQLNSDSAGSVECLNAVPFIKKQSRNFWSRYGLLVGAANRACWRYQKLRIPGRFGGLEGLSIVKERHGYYVASNLALRRVLLVPWTGGRGMDLKDSVTLSLDGVGNINAGGVQFECGFGGVRPCFPERRGSERFGVDASDSNGVIQSLVLVKEEIHVWRLDLGLVGLFQVRVAARFDLLDVIGVIEESGQLVRPQFVGLLGHYYAGLKCDPMVLFLEQGCLRRNMNWSLDLAALFRLALLFGVGRLRIRIG